VAVPHFSWTVGPHQPGRSGTEGDLEPPAAMTEYRNETEVQIGGDLSPEVPPDHGPEVREGDDHDLRVRLDGDHEVRRDEDDLDHVVLLNGNLGHEALREGDRRNHLLADQATRRTGRTSLAKKW